MKIYRPKGRAREYSPFALNYFKGCDNGCIYCYVPRILQAFESHYVHSNVIRPSALDIVAFDKEAQKFSKSKHSDEQILLSFTSDPYCNAEEGETREIIKILKKYNLHFNILTKNIFKAKRDIDLLKDYPFVKIGTTLTCSNDIDSIRYEPYADQTSLRLSALESFWKEGIKTWVSFEPVLFPDQTLELIETVANYVTDIKVGKLNNCRILGIPMVDWKKFLHDVCMQSQAQKVLCYIKNDLAEYDRAITLSPNYCYIRTGEDVFNI